MEKDVFDNFQIFNGTTTSPEEKQPTYSKLGKVSKANADTLEHYKRRQEAQRLTKGMIQQLRTDVKEGKPYSKLFIDALTVISSITGEHLIPNQIKTAVQIREIEELREIAQRHDEADETTKRVIAEEFMNKQRELNHL